MRVERPTGPPPQARWRAHAPPPRPAPPAWAPGCEPRVCKLAHLPSPRLPDNLASTSRARTPFPPAFPPNPKPVAVLQRCPRRPPPRSRSAPFHPRGCPSHSFLKHPSALWGAENPPGLGRPGPKLSKGKKVKGEAGGHKQIFFFSFLKGHCRFKSFFPGPPLSGSPYFGGAYLISATRLSSSLRRKIKARG